MFSKGQVLRQDEEIIKVAENALFYKTYCVFDDFFCNVSHETVTCVTRKMSKEQRTRHKRMTKYSESRQRGNVGEDIACLFLMKQGFSIVERNYLKPWGEIDIISKKKDQFHFVEVKSVSCEIAQESVPRETISKTRESVTRETSDCGPREEAIRPEEHMTREKNRRLERTIKTYFVEHKISHETAHQLDLLTVRFDQHSRIALVEYFEKVV